jgi:MerR family transcriptional regulator, copper efflux regulator
MRIGELARALGVTTKAVRFYEAGGLLPGPARAANRYRDYGPDEVQRLRVLVGLRRLDVPLTEAAELARLCADGQCDRVADGLGDAIAVRRAQIAARSAELQTLDSELERLDAALAAGAPPRPLIQVRRKEDDSV